MKKIIYYLIVGLIFILSFRCYSSLFYPLLNSDNAVSILMLHYFKLPDDFYFWGQDRIGSLIPLLGQILFKGFNFSALTSEAITHYIILLFGFLAFASFVKSYFFKIIFALIWFFPPMRLIDVTQFAFGVQYSLIAIACYLFNNANRVKYINEKYYYFLLFLSCLVFIVAIWVSDMALVTVIVFLLVNVYCYFNRNSINIKNILTPELYFASAGLIAGYIFISFAKSFSAVQTNYALIGSINEILNSTKIFSKSLFELFSFNANESFTSVYSYLVIILIGIVMFNFKNIKLNADTRKWLLIFLIDAIVLFAVIIVSKWTFMNNVPRRYFTCTYISLSFVIILALDNIVVKKQIAIFLKIILLITVVVGGVGTIYNLKYVFPKTLKPKVEIVNEFKSLGRIGIISEYWNSYITSCPNPNNIIATPHDKAEVRNKKLVEDVFKQDKIYVIKDMWFDNFPDTIKQFGRNLLKDGNDFNIGDCSVCKYKKI